MSSRPSFSILLPTYNRGEILPLAIQSVLDQTFDDFELVISNGGSTDTTDEVVRRFTDSRIKYFHSDKKLSMAENYDFALSKANGEYLIFFSDDDAFIPEMLNKVRGVINDTSTQMIVFPFARYYHEEQRGLGIKKNTLAVTKFSRSIFSVSSRDDILRMVAMFGLAKHPHPPQSPSPLIGNVVIHRQIFEELAEKVEKFFSTIPVDIYLITLILARIDRYFVIDEPLLVWSQWSKNSSISIGSNLREHYENLLAGRSLEHVPLKFPLPMNCSANAILTAFRDMGLNPIDFQLDWTNYYLSMLNYLIYLDGEGVDVSRERAELNKALKDLDSEVRHSVLDSRATRRFRFMRTLKQSTIGRILKILKGRLSRPQNDDYVYSGTDLGFKDVGQSAKYLGQTLGGMS